jgi:hypothetical protein
MGAAPPCSWLLSYASKLCSPCYTVWCGVCGGLTIHAGVHATPLAACSAPLYTTWLLYTACVLELLTHKLSACLLLLVLLPPAALLSHNIAALHASLTCQLCPVFAQHTVQTLLPLCCSQRFRFTTSLLYTACVSYEFFTRTTLPPPHCLPPPCCLQRFCFTPSLLSTQA